MQKLCILRGLLDMSVQKCRISRGFLGSGVQKLAWGASWRGLVCFLEAFSKFWLGFLRKLLPGWVRVTLSWRQVGARCAEAGPCWRQDGDLVLSLTAFGLVLARFGIGLGSILAISSESKGIEKPYVFKCFSIFSAAGEACRGILGAVLNDVGSNIAFLR